MPSGFAGIDAGQRHTVEGVVLAGRINRHITEYQQISHFGYGVKAVITDDVPGQAGRPGQAHGTGLLAGSPAPSNGGR